MRTLLIVISAALTSGATAQLPSSFYKQNAERPKYTYPRDEYGPDGYKHCSPVRASFFNAQRIRAAKAKHYAESREARIAANPELADTKALFAKNMALASGHAIVKVKQQTH